MDLTETLRDLRQATAQWLDALERVARDLEQTVNPSHGGTAPPPRRQVVDPPPKPARRPHRKTPAGALKAATGVVSAPPAVRPAPAQAAKRHDEPPPAPLPALKRPTRGGLDGPLPGLPKPLTKAPNALSDEQRAESWPQAETIARNLVAMLGAGHPQLRDGLKGQLALEHVAYDEELLSDALTAAERP